MIHTDISLSYLKGQFNTRQGSVNEQRRGVVSGSVVTLSEYCNIASVSPGFIILKRWKMSILVDRYHSLDMHGRYMLIHLNAKRLMDSFF